MKDTFSISFFEATSLLESKIGYHFLFLSSKQNSMSTFKQFSRYDLNIYVFLFFKSGSYLSFPSCGRSFFPLFIISSMYVKTIFMRWGLIAKMILGDGGGRSPGKNPCYAFFCLSTLHPLLFLLFLYLSWASFPDEYFSHER